MNNPIQISGIKCYNHQENKSTVRELRHILGDFVSGLEMGLKIYQGAGMFV